MISRFEGIIRSFSAEDFSGDDLIRLLVPSAPELKDRGVPADQVYYMVSEKTVTLRTRDPKIGILWWLKPDTGTAIQELHIKPLPIGDMEPFAIFRRIDGLGAETSHYQNGGLSDIIHIFKACFGSARLDIAVNEIVYSGAPELIGKVGEVTLRKPRTVT